MFVRYNTLTRKFSKCSVNVKVALFRSYCLCLYDIALWNVYKTGSLLKFRSCYHKCGKLFFKYRNYDSITCMLLETGLPSLETIISNAIHVFNSKWSSCSNVLVTALHRLHLPYIIVHNYYCLSVCLSVYYYCVFMCFSLFLAFHVWALLPEIKLWLIDWLIDWLNYFWRTDHM